MSQPTVRIGILTYNGLTHTRRCLDSIRAHTTAPWTALVRDNASTDGETPHYLRGIDDARVSVHLGSTNRGVGGGRNWLLGQLVPDMQDDDVLVLLDNDIEVHAGWEQPFLDAFAAQPQLGVAGRWAFSMLVHDGWRDILAENGTGSGAVDTVQGCCFWIRGATARAVGLFDEELGRFWHEDDDFSVRALAAGWDVQRVHTDAIEHHEHGSGTALDASRVEGSMRNQRYLVTKWRTLGAIDESGVPRRPVAEAHAGLRSALAARLGRPLVRTELNSALVDAAQLLHTEVGEAQLGVHGSPLVQLLLSDTAQGAGPLATSAARVLARLDRLLQARRATAPAEAGTRRAFSAICTPHAWEDARWAATATAHLQDGSGRDFYARSEAQWRDGQLLHALVTIGALGRSTQLLLVGDAREPLVAALSQSVGELTLADHQAPSTDFVRSQAERPLGPAQLRSARWSLDAPAREGHGIRDVVVCPNLSQYATPLELEQALTALASAVRPGGVVAVGFTARVSGPADGQWCEATVIGDDTLLARTGLKRMGAAGLSVADEILLAAVPEDAVHARPRLARLRGAHCLSLATLVARKL